MLGVIAKEYGLNSRAIREEFKRELEEQKIGTIRRGGNEGNRARHRADTWCEMKQITSSQDLEELHGIARGLLGEECWQAMLIYPSELQLHWGKRTSYPSERLRGEYRGTWIFGVESSSWTLRCKGQLIVNSDADETTIKEKIRILEGAKTEEFKVGYPDLTVTIRFSHGCSLLLTPDPEAAGKGSDDEPLEDWTLFYPEGMWLGVGPGPVWRSQGAEEPLS